MSDEEVIGATAYPYTGEILVEVTGRDAEGTLVVHSYQFDPDDDGAVSPKGSVPDRHLDVVAEALSEKGFTPEPALAD